MFIYSQLEVLGVQAPSYVRKGCTNKKALFVGPYYWGKGWEVSIQSDEFVLNFATNFA